MRPAFIAFLALGAAALPSMAAPSESLTLESKIPLGEVKGRIDHLAIDLKRNWLYVAELGNNSVGVVDLNAGRVIHTRMGFNEPQGLAFDAAHDQVYVANGGDGVVSAFRGKDFSLLGSVDLGSDADNLRVDGARGRLLAGSGNGALVAIELGSLMTTGSATLPAHPEGFQLSANGESAFVNLPGAHQIATIDLRTMQQRSAWPTGNRSANFPMALGGTDTELWVVFRAPPSLVAFDTTTGADKTSLETCEDGDDLFVDRARHRIYVICGGGQVDVWQQGGGRYERVERLQTAPGARTGLFVPEQNRLYVAVRATANAPAAVWVFRLVNAADR